MPAPTFRFSTGTVAYPLFLVLSLWVIYWLDVRFGIDTSLLGVYPRKLSGLPGIFLSPWAHATLSHLYQNSLPLLIMLIALFYFYRSVSFRVLFYGLLLSGLFTWVFGRASYHIGASGMVYVLFGFLFFSGIFAKYYRLMALSLAVVFFYGSMIWYVFPIREGVSWEGHLGGFLGGLLLSIVYRKQLKVPVKYHWEEEFFNEGDDDFLRHFDAEGNFLEQIPEIEKEEDGKDIY
ncbi:MAG: rhomboid family intramembrane serine protease [Flavobacteriales bacterium CG_4_9_14_3_um_filter_40_17]|nr:MAG: rhomboid family intramembrane serine protease [Flavobacteriales bacterium CG_4_9_14_3_um_filter_40_17]